MAYKNTVFKTSCRKQVSLSDNTTYSFDQTDPCPMTYLSQSGTGIMM